MSTPSHNHRLQSLTTITTTIPQTYNILHLHGMFI